MQKIRKEQGITLLALVITIIILLILAGITINAITGDNGIIGNAGQAKEETEIANEKEIIEKATVQSMGNNKYGNIEESELFGNEKDDSFRGSIGAIYQTFGGEEVYPTLEEKAANLLYFLTKNHSFSDGNKRIAAALFLYFLDRNQALFPNGKKRIDDYALAALTIMIAESKPEEKDMMVKVVMNCLAGSAD